MPGTVAGRAVRAQHEKTLSKRKPGWTPPLAGALVLAGMLIPGAALGRPQANASLQAAVCARGTHADLVDSACFYGAVQGDLVLLRESPRDFGLGPYARAATVSFDDIRFDGGMTTHLPVHETFPLVLSLGGYVRHGAPGWEPGLSVTAFFGSRSYNYHGNYILTGGLVAGMQYGLPRDGEVVSFVGAQVDAFFLAAPFVLLYQALRH